MSETKNAAHDSTAGVRTIRADQWHEVAEAVKAGRVVVRCGDDVVVNVWKSEGRWKEYNLYNVFPQNEFEEPFRVDAHAKLTVTPATPPASTAVSGAPADVWARLSGELQQGLRDVDAGKSIEMNIWHPLMIRWLVTSNTDGHFTTLTDFGRSVLAAGTPQAANDASAGDGALIDLSPLTTEERLMLAVEGNKLLVEDNMRLKAEATQQSAAIDSVSSDWVRLHTDISEALGVEFSPSAPEVYVEAIEELQAAAIIDIAENSRLRDDNAAFKRQLAVACARWQRLTGVRRHRIVLISKQRERDGNRRSATAKVRQRRPSEP